MHAAVTVGRHLGRGAGDARAAEVLDADDQLLLEELLAGLDEHLLGERVTDLHARPLARTAAALAGVERLGRQDADPTDAVAAGLGAEQDDVVAGAGGCRQLDPVVRHDADAQCVDQRVAEVAGVEDHLAADVGQPETVAVAADAGDHTRQDAVRVGSIGGAEAQGVHHRDRTSPHRQDVAHDAADAGGGALVRLDVRRVVVRLDLEGDRQTVTDIDDSGVLAHADEQDVLGLGGHLLAELAQVHLARLVRAVLAPHHRVHRQLAAGGAALQMLADALVLVGLQTQVGERLLDVRRRLGVLDGVDVARHASTS